MISDTLFDAIQEIEDYERRMPAVYGAPAMQAKLDRLKAAMRAAAHELAAPPPVEVPS